MKRVDQRDAGRLPAWALLPGAFALVAMTHYALLRLPYYWDEAGYYIPAAWDFFRTGALVPVSSTPNSHPPLSGVLLAEWWHVVGFSVAATRLGMCLVAATALVGIYRMAWVLLPKTMPVHARNAVAIVTALLTGLYPVWFAQSTLAHADLFAAAATVWALSFYFERGVRDGALDAGPLRMRAWACVLFTLAALCKETSIATPLALAAWEAWLMLRGKRDARRAHLEWGAALVFPVFPLSCWYLYLRSRTGHFFGDPAYVQYNATTTMEPMRLALALFHRALHISTHMEMFVPVVLMLACMLLPGLTEKNGAARERIALPLQAALGVVVMANWIGFSVLGGALLTRYLLPVYALVLVECVATWRRRVRAWWWLAALTAVAFVAGCVVNPPYGFAPEDNLQYANFIRLQQDAVVQVQRIHAQSVLTAWPASDELRRPELGYLAKPVGVVPIDNFSAETVAKFLETAPHFDAVLIFATKYSPPGAWMGASEKANAQYFGFHHDLGPEEAAAAMGATVVWHEERGGMWAAVLKVNPTQDAMLR